jgi:fructose-1,6-bisphosphatase/inositol monophosphatase family enzyme
MRFTRAAIYRSLNRNSGLAHPTYTAPDGTKKEMLDVDKDAEDACRYFLTQHFGDDEIRVLGEETLWKYRDLDLSRQRCLGYEENDFEIVDGPEHRITAVLDMVDGSDLVERDLGNWCSAMVIFRPNPKPIILCSLIQNADDRIYGADSVGTFTISPNGDPAESLRGPEVRRLAKSVLDRDLPVETKQIAICFYGQKQKNLTTLPPGFLSWVSQSDARDRFRIYNLAGNPMMARLSNGENIHAVFEHLGQYPHDATPGAYIGLRAGAHLVDLNGKAITEEHLAQSLLRPSGARFRYVLGSTEELALEIAGALREGKEAFYECVTCVGAGAVSRADGDAPVCALCGASMVKRDRRGRHAVS